jgi:hypothetical protein
MQNLVEQTYTRRPSKELINLIVIIERHSHINILVIIIWRYIGGKSVAELDEREWDVMMNMNLKSAF